jgi:magnesium chelatase subunit I
MIVFSANPEDYTNRGNIITPLKDRIDSQIITHYPRTLEDARVITSAEQTAGDKQVKTPEFIKDFIEEVSFQARSSEFVDQSSGVSARVSISSYENMLSNVERRALQNRDNDLYPRMTDLYAIIPAITGKIELVYEGEQEGSIIVAQSLIGKAINTIFLRHFPTPTKEKAHPDRPAQANPYEAVIDFFSTGRKLELADDLIFDDYKKRLESIAGLRQIVKQFFDTKDERELLLRMELVLEGLHHNNIIAREEVDSLVRYADIFSDMLKGLGESR